MNNFKFFTFSLAFLIMLISCKNTDKIAVFNDGSVYHYEVKDRYNKLTVEEKKNINTTDDLFKFVRKIALEKIILSKAYSENLDKKDSLLKQLEKSKKDLCFDILKKKNIIDKIAIDKNDYKKFTKLYDLYQIVKRTNINDPKKNETEKQNLINMSKNTTDLNSFMENAKKYSDDVTSADGGHVGKIRLGVMEDEIDKAIQNMQVNKVSQVVESSNGLHLLFITSVDEVKIEEILDDKDLFDTIYNEKRIKLEEEWYDNLLKDKKLKINENLIRQNKQDNTAVIAYGDKKITGKEFFDIVNQYKQSNFPEPTPDDLFKLAKSLGLNLVIEQLSMNPNILKSTEFKQKLQTKKEFLMMNEYIANHLAVSAVTDEMIKNFYEKNKTMLFTFKLDDGKLYVQPLDEVKKFISQKIESSLIQNARIDIYKKLVENEKLNIDKEKLSKLKIDLFQEKI